MNQIGRAMWGFAVGLVLFEFRYQLSLYRKTTALIMFTLVPIYISMSALGNLQSFASVWPFSAIIIFLCNLNTPKNLSKLFEVMGKYSYGFYLWHFPMLSLTGIVVKYFSIESNAIYSNMLAIALCSALSLVATKVSLIIFEQPIRKLWTSKTTLI